MLLNDYQMEAHKFACYRHENTDDFVSDYYPFLALSEEAGEVAGKLAKAIRKGVPVDPEELIKELGDVLWQVQECSGLLNYTLEDVAKMNLEKLTGRAERGTLVGSGDNR